MRTICVGFIFWVLILGASAVLAAGSALPFSEGFEAATGFTINGTNIAGIHGWTSSGTAIATNSAKYGASILGCYLGDNGIASNEFAFTSDATNRMWTDIYVQAIGWESGPAPEIPAGVSTMFFVNTNQRPVVLSGSTWVTNSSSLWETSAWKRVTVFANYVDKKWALFLDGALVTQRLSFADMNVGTSSLFSVQGKDTMMDNLMVTNRYPSDLTLSSDGDSIPDAWEIHYLGTITNGATSDNDGDGINNGDEYRLGSTDPMNPASYPPTITVSSSRGSGYSYTLMTNSGVNLTLSVLLATVDGAVGTQYVCTNGTVDGNAFSCDSSGTNVTMNPFTNNATLTWNWKTQYRLTTGVNGQGSVTASSWQDDGAQVALTATPSEGWLFMEWSGDTNGCPYVSNVITAMMTEARSITAKFQVAMTGTIYKFK